LIQNRKYITNRALCYLQQLPYHVWNPMDETQSQLWASMNWLEWSAMMSQSFSMRIGFIMNIACPFKLSIAFRNYFNFPLQLKL
jgi:hypothetical protein